MCVWMNWIEQNDLQQHDWSRRWERQSLSVCLEENVQRYPEDTRACFVDKSCGKSRLTLIWWWWSPERDEVQEEAESKMGQRSGKTWSAAQKCK